jgi:hypothetical protein
MKPMEYKDYRAGSEVLHEDVYKGFRYCIVSHGTHPCIYVEIPEGHPYYGVRVGKDIDLEVHGGVTFHSSCPMVNMKYAIGWDYVHIGDYFNPAGSPEMELGHKWTTEELDAEAHMAIAQLYAIGNTLYGQVCSFRAAFWQVVREFISLPWYRIVQVVLLIGSMILMVGTALGHQWMLVAANALIFGTALINLFVAIKCGH